MKRLHDKIRYIIVAAWRGEGFKTGRTLRECHSPRKYVDLEEKGKPIFDEFTSKFGKPIVEVNCKNDKVYEILVRPSSPCGSTFFVAEEMIGQDLEDLPIKAGL